MIGRRVYFGIPLGSRTYRRRFVIVYWAMCVAVLSALAELTARDPGWTDHPWTLVGLGSAIGLLLFVMGGAGAAGPVRRIRWIAHADGVPLVAAGSRGRGSLGSGFPRRHAERRAAGRAGRNLAQRSPLPVLPGDAADGGVRGRSARVPVASICTPSAIWPSRLPCWCSSCSGALPQTLILWNEPDIEPLPAEQDQSAHMKHARGDTR